MNEITCRGCGRYESECTCNVLTTGNTTEADASLIKIIELVDELEQQDIRIKDLELINASHRIENGKLQERIKELEELMPTNGEIRLIKTALENESMRRYGNVKKDAPIFIRLAKLQAIIEGAI